MKSITVLCASAFSLIAFCASPVAAASLPGEISAQDPQLHYIGRFEMKPGPGAKCQWPASAVEICFSGTGLEARLNDSSGKNRWQVVIDGEAKDVLELKAGEAIYDVASGLKPGEHRALLVRGTEAHVGTSEVLGFQLSEGGKLLPPKPAPHHLLVIGDSISCGYGNEANAKEEHFTPKTENAYRTYGAMAARETNAEFVCIAWSGKKMWPDNTIPELFDRTLPMDAKSHWDPTQWVPDAIVITLGTNDFGKANPDEKGWTDAYDQFVAKLFTAYPQARVYCATSPMMGDWGDRKQRTVLHQYLEKIVAARQAAGQSAIALLDFPIQNDKLGYGADWHPNVKNHEVMAAILTAALRKDLQW
jgi:lysophospholipase L1-like esterase